LTCSEDGCDVQSKPAYERPKLLLQPSSNNSSSWLQGALFLPVSTAWERDAAITDSLLRYTDNGGSTLAISGNDFTIIAGDTRSTSGYSINTRYAPKVFKIGGTTESQDDATLVLSVVGFAADGDALKERLDAIVKMYRYQHGKPMSVKACAQRLSTILYGKRFFPYYVTAILGGLDEEGKGAVYSYDPVGSYEREQCRAAGAAASLIMPFLDNQVNFKNQYMPGSGEGHALQEREKIPLPRNEVEDLVKDAFDSAVERHIEVGDGLQILIITKEGIEEKYLPLKKD
jgi:20S proteasome subunit beta 6